MFVSSYSVVCVDYLKGENMFSSDDENDISWLTQEPSLESQKDNSNVFNDSDDDVNGIDGFFSVGNVVSLEDNVTDRKIHRLLYGNVVAEDISSDEELDRM